MENQHRQIKGYRDLTQTEIDLMNEVKAKGAELGALLDRVQQHLDLQASKNAEAIRVEAMRGISNGAREENDRRTRAEPDRWHHIAMTHFQEGLMALTRAIAQPDFF